VMALGRREKILAAITGALALVFVINLLFVGAGSFGPLQADRAKHEKDIAEKKKQACKAMRQLARWKSGRPIDADSIDLQRYRRYVDETATRLAQWESRSLPSDEGQARLLYRSWLRETVDRAGFRSVKSDPGESRTRRGVYTVLPVTVRCRAKLEQLTQFLYDFYSAGHLHRITLLSIKPDSDKGDLELTISIEGLSLPGADRKDALNDEPAKRLALAEFSDYRDSIVKRNLFAAYVPPPPPVVKRKPPKRRPPRPTPPPRPPEFDHAKHTVVTGLVEVGGRRQVWLLIRTTGEQLKLFEGEKFSTGSATGTIGHVGQRNVEIEFDGKRRLVAFGENVADGAELPE